jgi:hypothetical protein
LIIEDNHIDRIIARYIANEASQEDLLLLREWMDQAPENKRYVENIRLLQDKALAAHSPVKVDTSKAWEKVKAQLDLSVQATAPKKSSSYLCFNYRCFNIILLFINWFQLRYDSL